MNRKMNNKGILMILITMAVFVFSGFILADKYLEIKIKTSAVCGMCKDRIEGCLAFEKGVKSATLDVETKVVTVAYNPAKTSPDQLRKTISKLGYDADTIPAGQAAYARLPACCKKDAPEHK